MVSAERVPVFCDKLWTGQINRTVWQICGHLVEPRQRGLVCGFGSATSSVLKGLTDELGGML